MFSIPNRPRAGRRALFHASLVLLPMAAIAGGCEDAQTRCARAAQHAARLQQTARGNDAVLAANPDVAEALETQQRAAVTKIVSERCERDPRYARCILDAQDARAASRCATAEEARHVSN